MADVIVRHHHQVRSAPGEDLLAAPIVSTVVRSHQHGDLGEHFLEARDAEKGLPAGFFQITAEQDGEGAIAEEDRHAEVVCVG